MEVYQREVDVCVRYIEKEICQLSDQTQILKFNNNQTFLGHKISITRYELFVLCFQTILPNSFKVVASLTLSATTLMRSQTIL